MSDGFVHLHVHSDYSLLDGACDVSRLVARAAERQMPAVALTDHGNLFGAVSFFQAAAKSPVKPILGCELYICKKPDHREPPEGDSYNHLIVLCENERGYRNLVKIVSEASLHGFYYKPRISKKFLAEHSDGLIGLSACLKGEVQELISAGRPDDALRVAGEFSDIFGRDRFYIEVQDQGLEQEHRIKDRLLEVACRAGLPLVATNDCHYLDHDDSKMHDVLLCIQTGKRIQDEQRMRFGSDQFYLKTAQEMLSVFSGIEDAVHRTLEIAERCNLKLETIQDPFPQFDVPEGETLDSYFERVAREGMARREPRIEERRRAGRTRYRHDDYQQRLDREISVIRSMRYAGYFLIVWDFIRYAREQGIPVGPGRGSAAGSLVSFAMGITDIDPMENELLFERFLNPERVSMPDIDIDFCMNRRGEVIDYVTRKYGRENVSQIITFGTMAAKAAIKDVGRVMDLPYGEVDRIAKLIPNQINITLDKALDDVPQLRELCQSDTRIGELMGIAKKVEGLCRHAGMHAAGVVIAPRPLTEIVPLFRTNRDEIVTQYDMNGLEKIGLLKMDFLGLTTLTIIDDALKLIRQNRGVSLDLADIPENDAAAYEIFCRGTTNGVFQFESSGMRDILKRYRPERLSDLTALNALYRPGPIQGGMIDDFIDRKHGRRRIQYELPELEPILSETLGVFVYQEQVMQAANRLAGYSLGEADLLRRAMGKKKPDEMALHREKFVRGAVARGLPQPAVEHIFDLMAQFAGYGFNKSHSAAYALVAYQTAYLKAHYPVEFMAALLTSQTGNSDNVVKYLNECREMRIPVLPPDIVFSDADFTPHGDAIRFGLSAIKNVGETTIRAVVEARGGRLDGQKAGGVEGTKRRSNEAGAQNTTGFSPVTRDLQSSANGFHPKPFTGLFDFCKQVGTRALNKRVIESLIKSGALDSFGPRAALMSAAERALDYAQKGERERESGQHGLFLEFHGNVGGDDEPPVSELPVVAEWDEATRLMAEKEVLGFFVSGHPLDRFADLLGDLDVVSASRIAATNGKDEIGVAGVLGAIQFKRNKKGESWATAQLEDRDGRLELLCFAEAYRRLEPQLRLTTPVLVKGRVLADGENDYKLQVSDIRELASERPQLPRALRVRVPLDRLAEGELEKLVGMIAQRPGPAKIHLQVQSERDGFEQILELEPTVTADFRFRRALEDVCGPGSLRVID